MADKFKIEGNITFRHDAPSLDAEVKKIKAKLAGISSVKDIIKIEIAKDTVANISSLNSKLKDTLLLVQQIELSSRAVNQNFQSLNKIRSNNGLAGVKEKVNRQAVLVGESTVQGVEQGLEKAKPKIVSLVDTFLGGVQVRFSQFLKFAVAAFIVDQARTAFNTGFEAVLKIDDAQNKLRQITGESKESVAELGKEIANLGKQLGTSTTGLAKVAETIAQAGFSLSQTRDIVKEIALTELAPSFGNLDETTDALIAVTEQFELIDKSAKKAPAIGKYFDIVNRLSKEYAVEARDLSEATKLAGASFAAAADIQPGNIDRNLDEFRKLASLITVVRSQTRISAPQIGTGLKTLATRLQNINIQEELNSIFGDDLGLRDQEGRFIGVLESFAKIEAALDRLGDKGKGTSEVFAQVTQALGGDRQAKILPAILQRTSEVYDVLANARRNDNSVLEDSVLAQERVSIKLAKINREIISFAVGVAESSGFKQFLDYLYEITKAALNVAAALKPLIPLVNSLVLINVASYAGRKLGQSFQRVDQDLLSRVKQGPSAYFSASATRGRKGKRTTVGDEDYNFFNRGGYVNALVTPGEEIFAPDQVSRIGQSKLASYNYAGSRTGINERGMIVPGQGNGDSVPMQIPHGSFVVKKNSVQRFSDGGGVDDLYHADNFVKNHRGLDSMSQSKTKRLLTLMGIKSSFEPAYKGNKPNSYSDINGLINLNTFTNSTARKPTKYSFQYDEKPLISIVPKKTIAHELTHHFGLDYELKDEKLEPYILKYINTSKSGKSIIQSLSKDDIEGFQNDKKVARLMMPVFSTMLNYPYFGIEGATKAAEDFVDVDELYSNLRKPQSKKEYMNLKQDIKEAYGPQTGLPDIDSYNLYKKINRLVEEVKSDAEAYTRGDSKYPNYDDLNESMYLHRKRKINYINDPIARENMSIAKYFIKDKILRGIGKYNSGGLVRSLLTPGEKVLLPNKVNQIGLSTLEKINDGTYKVPGKGNTDTVPADLPNGSFVLRKKFASGGHVGFEKFAGGSSKLPKYNEGPIPESIFGLSKILSDVFNITITGMRKVKEQIPEGVYRASENKIMVRSDLSKASALPNLGHELVHALGIDKENLVGGITGESIKRDYARKAEEQGINRSPEQINKEVNATLFGDYVKNNPNIKRQIEKIYKTLLDPKVIAAEAEALAKYNYSLDPTVDVNEAKAAFITSQTEARKAQAQVQISNLIRQAIISQGQGNKSPGEYLKFGTGYGVPGSRIPAQPGLVPLTSKIPKNTVPLGPVNPRKIGEAIYQELLRGNKTAKQRFEADPSLIKKTNDIYVNNRLKLLYAEAKQERRKIIQSGADPSTAETTKQIFQRKAYSQLAGESTADDLDRKRSKSHQEYLELRRSTLVSGISGQRNSGSPLVFLNKTMKEQADKMIADIRKEAKKPSFIQKFRENLFLPVSTGFFGAPSSASNVASGTTPVGDPNDAFSAFRSAQPSEADKEKAAKAAYKADRKMLSRQKAGNIVSGVQSIGLIGGLGSSYLLQQDQSDSGQTGYSAALGAFGGAIGGATVGSMAGPYGAAVGAIGGAIIGGLSTYQGAKNQINSRQQINKASILESINRSLLEKGNPEDEKQIFQNVFKIGINKSRAAAFERGDNLQGTRASDFTTFFKNPFNTKANLKKLKEDRLKLQREELGSSTTAGVVDVLKATEDRDFKSLVESNEFGIDNIKRVQEILTESKLLREASIREGSARGDGYESEVDPLLLYNKSQKIRRSITGGNKDFSRLVFKDTYAQLNEKEKKKVDENILKNKKGIEEGKYDYLDAFSGTSRDVRDRTEEKIIKDVISIKEKKKEENDYQQIASKLDSFVQSQIQKANVLKQTSELFDFAISEINSEISSVRTGQLGNLKGPESIIGRNIKGSSIQEIQGLSTTLPGFEKDISSIASAEALRRNFLPDYEADKSDKSPTEKIKKIIKAYIPGSEDNKFINNEIQKIFSNNIDEETNISNVRASEIDQLLTTYVDNLSEPLKIALELRDKALDNLSSGINEIASKRVEQRNLKLSGNTSAFNADRRLAQLQGTEIFTAGDEYKKQVNTVLGTQDFRLDPQRLFNNIEQNQARIAELKDDPSILTNKKLQDELKDLVTATTSGAQALDMLTDRSAELSDVFGKLERDQKRISGSRDVLLGGIYGGRKAQEESRKSFDLLRRLEAGALNVAGLGDKERDSLRAGIEDLKKISPEAAAKAESKLLTDFGKANGLTGANIALPFGGGNINFDRVAANKLDQALINQKNELLAKETAAINLKNQLIDKELALLEKRIALDPNDPLGTKKVANKQVSGHISIGGLVDVKVNLDEQDSLKQSIEKVVNDKVVASFNAFAKNNPGFNGI